MHEKQKRSNQRLAYSRHILPTVGSLLLWLSANALAPIILPVFFLYAVKLLQGEQDVSFCILFQQLLAEGFYIFSSLALACSLLEDYKVFNKTINWIEAALITSFMIAIGYIFYQVKFVNENYFMEHFNVFLMVWIPLAIVSSELKFRMILKKQR